VSGAAPPVPTLTRFVGVTLALAAAATSASASRRAEVLGLLGSGKATLFRALLQPFDPRAGAVLADGVVTLTREGRAVRVCLPPLDPQGGLDRSLLQ
jgi:ABC-type phosphate/phosphonate transport system ATPase subunit